MEPNTYTRKYHAFISYRHDSGHDEQTARLLRRRLELFWIPAKVRKETGIKTFFPVFLDRDELPITVDINDDIRNALRDARFLIVVCSPRVFEPGKTWVQREINEYLRTHDQQHVLVALSEGNPADVFPEVLRHVTRTYIDENGVEQTVVEEIEPLAANFLEDHSHDDDNLIGRLVAWVKKRRDTRDEVTRLAAALLGVPYDSLIRRVRRRRRIIYGIVMAVIAAASIGFARYAQYKEAQIYEQYQESLKNQSTYLASEGMDLLTAGDRLGATELALYALPENGDDARPLLPMAERALQQASLAYMDTDDETLTLTQKMAMPGHVERAEVSENGEYLVLQDDKHVTRVFELDTGRVLGSTGKRTDFQISDVAVGNDGLAYVMDVGTRNWTVACIDVQHGKEMWRWEDGRDADSILDRWQRFSTNDGELRMLDNGTKLLALVAQGALILDAHDGTALQTIPLPFEGSMGTFGKSNVWINNVYSYGYQMARTTISNDERYALVLLSCNHIWAFRDHLYEGEESGYTGDSIYDLSLLVRYDLKTGEVLFVKGVHEKALCCAIDAEGCSYCISDGGRASWGDPDGRPIKYRLTCDDASGRRKWEQTLYCVRDAETARIDFGSSNLGGDPQRGVAISLGSAFFFLDRETGEQLRRCEATQTIMAWWERQPQDEKGGKQYAANELVLTRPNAVLADGSFADISLYLGTFDPNEGNNRVLVTNDFFSSDDRLVTICDTYACAYELSVGDAEHQALPRYETVSYAGEATQAKDATNRIYESAYGNVYVHTKGRKEDATVGMLSGDGDTWKWHTTLEVTSLEPYLDVLGVSYDGSSLVAVRSDKILNDGSLATILVVSLEDGSISRVYEEGVAAEHEEGRLLVGKYPFLTARGIVSVVPPEEGNSSSPGKLLLTPLDGSPCHYLGEEGEGLRCAEPVVVSPDGSMMVVDAGIGTRYEVRLIDIEAESDAVQLPVCDTWAAAWRADGALLACVSREHDALYVVGTLDGIVVSEVSLEGSAQVDAVGFDGDLLVARIKQSGKCYLDWYDTDTGKRLNRIADPFAFESDGVDVLTFTPLIDGFGTVMQLNGGNTHLKYGSHGVYTYVLCNGVRDIRAYFSSYGYDSERNSFLWMSDDNDKTVDGERVLYPWRTVAEMREYGKRVLGNSTLGKERLSAYGI